jgi:protein involved in polysaccharide export with SLBB domain
MPPRTQLPGALGWQSYTGRPQADTHRRAVDPVATRHPVTRQRLPRTGAVLDRGVFFRYFYLLRAEVRMPRRAGSVFVSPAFRDMLRLLWLALLTLACFVPRVAAAQHDLPPAADVVLLPGDSLGVTIWRNDQLSGRFVVGPDSALTHPLYQEVKIAGIPYAEAKLRLQRFLERFGSSPQFTLEPLQRVLISGDMVSSNFFRFGPEVTITQALLIAGATPERLKGFSLHMNRGGREYVIPLNARPEVLAMEVRSGDQLVLKQRTTPRTVFNRSIAVLGTVSSLVTMYTFFANTLLH